MEGSAFRSVSATRGPILSSGRALQFCANRGKQCPLVDVPTIDEITDELREVALQVHLAQERKEERELVIAAQQGVERLSRRYREMYGALSAGDQMRVDRTLGRRVVDIKRLASLLPKVTSVAGDSTPDRMAGSSTVGERRITGVSWKQGQPAAATLTKLSVGAEIEAWCGKCGEITNHNIVALVGNEPKQVLCQVCNSRHAHRTTPARRSPAETAAAAAESRPKTPQDVEAAKKAELLRLLALEVNAAPEIKAFDPKQRYKVGDIISHPDFGRGKIENVLRSSLLVRFPIGGLKSLMLI
jgi:hypothetical protein